MNFLDSNRHNDHYLVLFLVWILLTVSIQYHLSLILENDHFNLPFLCIFDVLVTLIKPQNYKKYLYNFVFHEFFIKVLKIV